MAVFREIKTVTGGAASVVITHNLNDANAKLVGFMPSWPGRPHKTAQDANTITVTFGAQCPVGGGTGDIEVQT